MPLKSQTIFNFKYRRPTDDATVDSVLPHNSQAPAKYYRKVACPSQCENEVVINDVFGDVRTCPKVIGGSNRCVPLNANSKINANVPVDVNGNLTKKYYASSRAYLQARCRTYDQRSFHFTNSSTGELQANCCGNDAGYVSGNCRTVAYKPNNKKYSTQGAVTASSRILRLKYNTITASSGPNNANCPSCVKYPSNQTQTVPLQTNTPFLCFRRNGTKTGCA